MPHETLVENVKCHIDDISFRNGETIIYGWCFHLIRGILPIRLLILNDEDLIRQEFIVRDDVAKFYENTEINNCGFCIVFKESSHYAELQIQIDDLWYTFKTFRFDVIRDQIASMNRKAQEEQKAKEDLAPKIVHLDNSNDHNFNLTKKIPEIVVVDNFYENPDSVRKFALTLNYKEHKDYHKGKRTDEAYWTSGLQERFEQLLGTKIKNFNNYKANGCFQYCIAGDNIVYHCDLQQYAGIVYLTPNAPLQSGTRTHRSKITGKGTANIHDRDECNRTFPTGFLDPHPFETDIEIGNNYNRLVLFKSDNIHSATSYFGNSMENGRLFQLFFFDIDQ